MFFFILTSFLTVVYSQIDVLTNFTNAGIDSLYRYRRNLATYRELDNLLYFFGNSINISSFNPYNYTYELEGSITDDIQLSGVLVEPYIYYLPIFTPFYGIQFMGRYNLDTMVDEPTYKNRSEFYY